MPKLVPSWQWAPGGRQRWVIRGYLAASFDINQSHSDDTQTARSNHFGGNSTGEQIYKRKIFSLYQNIFWYPSSSRRCLNHLVTVLGQIWNDLQLLIGVFREAGGRSLPLNNNSSLILDHNFGLSDLIILWMILANLNVTLIDEILV